eukprot:SAG22_NODE_4812_length_1158_cov_1.361662_2_plen_155_part_00
MARAPTPVEMTDPLKSLGGPKLGRSTPGPVGYGGSRVFSMLEQLESDNDYAQAVLEQAMPALNMARTMAAQGDSAAAERAKQLAGEIQPKFKAAQRAKAALVAGRKGAVSLSSKPSFGRKEDTFARPLTGATDDPTDYKFDGFNSKSSTYTPVR